jgi:hypothetical protein
LIPIRLCNLRSAGGDHQFHSPSKAINAGTSVERTTNASTSTATTAPSAISLRKMIPDVANAPIATASSTADALTTRPVCSSPTAIASRLSRPPSRASLIRAITSTP